MVPHETKTLLDVGSEIRFFLDFLKDEYSGSFSALVGVDRSETALGHVRDRKEMCDH